MKILSAATLAFACLGASPGFGATPAATPKPIASPVAGFVTFDLPEGTADGQPGVSLKSIGLVNGVEAQGVAETARSTVIIDRQAEWQDDQFNSPARTLATATHYVELTTGPRAGAVFDIVRTLAARKTLLLGEAIPANAGPKVGYRIRRHWTLSSLFGPDDEAGLRQGDESTADRVTIYSGATPSVFYYSNDPTTPGWRRVGGGLEDDAQQRIYPDDGIMISRADLTPAALTLTGFVKSGRASVPVVPGTNLLGNVYPVPLTLASSHLYTGNAATGVRPGNATTADKLQLFNGQTYDTYYYQAAKAHLTAGWRKIGDPTADAGSVQIPAGGAILLQRSGRTGFNWIIPSPLP